MTFPLPWPYVEQPDGSLHPHGVQLDLTALAKLFPLSASSGSFVQFPQCRVYRTTDTGNIASGAWTAIGFDAEDYDLGTTDGNHDGVNTTRLTCRVPGLYTIVANVAWEANATGPRGLRIRLNGGNRLLGEEESGNAGAANYTQLNVTGQFRLAVNDYVEAEAMQTSGGNLVVKADSNISVTAFSFCWESP